MRKLLLFILLGTLPTQLSAQQFCDVKGRILVQDTDEPIGEAVVEIPRHGLWAITDKEGRFTVRGVPRGKTTFVLSCLGYATTLVNIEVIAGMDALHLYLPEDNLALESVVVTAREAPDAMATSRTVGGNAIDHLQMVNASDISALLPGGKTVNPDLTTDNPFSLRDGGSTAGNATFGTAVEVDGVRLSTNASLGDMAGASTRNIASTNIEAVEVITGVPSAEYGDISSGIVRLRTRKGKTPYTLTFTTNPQTKQASFSKGFDLGENNGVLNTNLEYARATKNPVSPYTSYSRTGLSLSYQNTFANTVRFNFGVAGNLGGQNTKNDPDAQNGEWQKVKDDALRINTSINWQPNRKGLTSLDFNASINYENKLERHIPSIRMIITLRLEAMLLHRQQNLSEWNGRTHAFNVAEDSSVPTGGDIYDGNSYTAIWPVAYLDQDGVRHPFTDVERNDPAFASMLLRSGNAYQYRLTDYDPYFSANLSVTKEIGDHVSISFYANNFTNSRKYVRPYAGGVGSIFTPKFYYGLTVRIKF